MVRCEEIHAKKEKKKIEPMDMETFEKMLKKIPKGKAPDIFFNTVEHYINASREVKEALLAICNEMILDGDKYSSPLLSMSTSTYLYKGKNKKRTNPLSYRKVSIGSICNKIVDCYMEDTVKGLIRSKQSDLQFGFTKGVDLKGCTVLRETAVNHNTEKGKMTMLT